MRISEIGEFGLINLVAKMVNSSRDEGAASWQNLIIGIGDDAAAWRGDTSTQLGTVDCLVQDVHFSLDIISWEELGWRALAVNLSDIAAMGGFPRYALVSLALPEHTEVESVLDLYRGMLRLAKESGVAIVGGNMSKAPRVFIDITIIGDNGSQDGSLLARSAAVPGDKIAVTGYLGTAAAGLVMLTKRLQFDAETTEYLRNAFVHPCPRLAEGRLLVEQGVRTGIDISDGLISDLGHICELSRVGATLEIDRVPIHPAVKASFGDKSLELALSGGDDYELLFTAQDETIDRIKQAASCPITVIGKISAEEAGKITLVDSKGNRFSPYKTGWDHFAQTASSS